MDEHGNPYRPGAGTRPPLLAGRDDLLHAFEVAVRRALRGQPGQSLVATGLRGVGKTVLLLECLRIAEAARCTVVQIESSEGGAFVVQLGQALRKVLLRLDSGPASRAVNRALKVLKSFSLTEPHGFKLAIDLEPEAGASDSGELDLDLADLFEAAAEAARDRKTAIVIAIDEIQYLNPSEFGALIAANHRTVQRDLPLVLVGAGLPQLPALAGEAKSYAERLFTFPRIGALDRASADEAVVAPARDLGVTFSREALDRIYERSSGYPYFLQEFAYATWNAALGPERIELADVEHAEGIVEKKLDENFFAVRVEQLANAERDYVQAMAQLGDGPYRSAEIADAMSKTLQGVATLREGLIAKGMIFSPRLGELEFSVPLFAEFLRRNPLEKRGRARRRGSN
jgi:hypothetical protein